MAPRPHWKGFLKLGLVSCPIALYPAVSANKRVSFRRINKATGNRLRQRWADEAANFAPVEAPDESEKARSKATSALKEDLSAHDHPPEPEIAPGRGYEIGSGSFIPVSKAELDATRVERSRTIEITKVVPRSQVDLRYLHTPYLIVPNDDVGQLAFAVIREALAAQKMAALGTVVMSARERPMLLEPMGKGIRGTTLRYPYEVRAEAQYFDDIEDIKVDPKMLQVADVLLDAMKGDFEPSAFTDRQEEAVVELLRNKQAALALTSRAASAANTANLMQAFQRSVAGLKGPVVRPSPRPSAALKRAALKRPMGRNRKTG